MTQPDEVHSEFERRLLDQYRAAADEAPPPALDRAILDQARRAAAQSHPQAVRGPITKFAADVNDAPRLRRDESRWGRPLALAAALVLGIGIVVRYEMQSPDLSPPADAPADAAAPASTPASAPAPSQNAAPAGDTGVAASAANAPAPAAAPAAEPAPPAGAAKDSAIAPAPKVSQYAPASPAEAPVESEKRRAAPAEARARAAAPEGRVDSMMRNNLAREDADKKIRDQAAAELAKADAGKPQPGAGGVGAGAPMPLAPSLDVPPDLSKPRASRRENVAAGATAPSPAAGAINADAVPVPVPAPAAAPAPAPARTAPFYEGDPDLWARHIIDLRHAGRNGTADAELKRLRARYPEFKLPADALPPAPPATEGAPAAPQ